jgi:hypothetical protein
MADGDKEKIDAAIKRLEEKSWVHNLKRNVRAYMDKRKQRKVDTDTARTKTVTTDLSASGLTEKEIKRLRGE